MWLQGSIRRRDIILKNIHTNSTPADLMTKFLSAETMERHIHWMGFWFVDDEKAKDDVLALACAPRNTLETMDPREAAAIRPGTTDDVLVSTRNRRMTMDSREAAVMTDDVLAMAGVPRNRWMTTDPREAVAITIGDGKGNKGDFARTDGTAYADPPNNNPGQPTSTVVERNTKVLSKLRQPSSGAVRPVSARSTTIAQPSSGAKRPTSACRRLTAQPSSGSTRPASARNSLKTQPISWSTRPASAHRCLSTQPSSWSTRPASARRCLEMQPSSWSTRPASARSKMADQPESEVRGFGVLKRSMQWH